jgi:hypothetical protein
MVFGAKKLWPFKGGGAAVAELEPELDIAEPAFGAPRLTMLVADASGFASYKEHTFFDAETAADFIKTWYGKRVDHGIVAFWAMTQRPDVQPEPGSDTAVEAIVLVRDDALDDVVYPFSFVDMDEANAFVRFEMQRGVDPNLMQVFWAVPVQLAVTADGGIRVFPDRAPDALREEFRAPPPEFARRPSATEAPILEPARPMIKWSAATTEDDPIEALFRKAPPAFLKAFENEVPASNAEESLVEFTEGAGGGDKTQEQQIAELTFADAGGPSQDDGAETPVEATETDSAVEFDEPVEVLATEEAKEESAVEEAVEETVEADDLSTAPGDGDDAWEGAGEQFAEEETTSFEDAVAPVVREILTSAEPVGTEFPAGRAYARAETPTINSREELQKVLKVRRWDERSGPFSGFDSPPGRF